MSTIKEVAQRANVSVTTVSRVINNNGYVHKDTKEIINKAIMELNYLPIANYEELTKEFNYVGIIINNITSTVKSKLLDVIQDELLKRNYKMILALTRDSLFLEDYYLEKFESEKVCGVIIADNIQHIDKLLKLNKPIISVDYIINSNTPSVTIDYSVGSKEVVNCFVSNNAENVLVCINPTDNKYRYTYITKTLDETNIKYTLYNELNDNDNNLYLLLKNNTFDAIYTSSDFIAIKINSILNSLNIKVPKDCILLGFDNSPFSTLISPTLSTINYPVHDIATTSVNTICNIIDSREYLNNNTTIEATLIERESTKKDAY